MVYLLGITEPECSTDAEPMTRAQTDVTILSRVSSCFICTLSMKNWQRLRKVRISWTRSMDRSYRDECNHQGRLFLKKSLPTTLLSKSHEWRWTRFQEDLKAGTKIKKFAIGTASVSHFLTTRINVYEALSRQFSCTWQKAIISPIPGFDPRPMEPDHHSSIFSWLTDRTPWRKSHIYSWNSLVSMDPEHPWMRCIRYSHLDDDYVIVNDVQLQRLDLFILGLLTVLWFGGTQPDTSAVRDGRLRMPISRS